MRAQGVETKLEYQTSELFVSGQVLYSHGRGTAVHDRIEVALAEQPRADTLQYPRVGDADESRSLVVHLRAGVPVRFEAIRVVP